MLAPNASNALTPSADAGSAARDARTLTAENLANNPNFQKYLQTGIDFNAPSLANLRTKSKEELLAIKSQLVNANVDDAQAVYLSVMGVSAKVYQDHIIEMRNIKNKVIEDFPTINTISQVDFATIYNNAVARVCPRTYPVVRDCNWEYFVCGDVTGFANQTPLEDEADAEFLKECLSAYLDCIEF